jgi:ankyrin repeat protein
MSEPSSYLLADQKSVPPPYLPPGQTSGASSFSHTSSAPPTNGAPPQSRLAARREKEALTKELIQALDNTDITQIATLLGAGADPNARGIALSLENTEHWAIYIVAYKKRNDMVKLLIDHGADINPPTGTPPLMAAVRAKYEEGVELLIDSCANTNAVSPVAGTALQIAVIYRNLSMVQLLIDGGPMSRSSHHPMAPPSTPRYSTTVSQLSPSLFSVAPTSTV